MLENMSPRGENICQKSKHSGCADQEVATFSLIISKISTLDEFTVMNTT